MAEKDTQPKVCKRQVKDNFGNVKTCDTSLRGECRNRREHILPFKSGFCANGFCEGKSVKGSDGRVAKPCTDWKHCPCECHLEIDRMFSMMQQPREYTDLSGYEPPKSPYRMLSLDERVALHAQAKEAVVVPSEVPDLIPASVVKEVRTTPSGRTSRGGLEQWVKEACDEWLIEKYNELCTPKWLAVTIGQNQGIAPPSQGAIDAVFKRWLKLGFAKIEFKPTRFTGYTEEGIKLGLEAMKMRAQDSKKSTRAAQSRVIQRR